MERDRKPHCRALPASLHGCYGNQPFVIKSLSHFLHIHLYTIHDTLFSFCFKGRPLSVAGRETTEGDREMKPPARERVQPESVCQSERGRGGELLSGRRSQLSVTQGPVIHPTEDERIISVSLTHYTPAL